MNYKITLHILFFFSLFCGISFAQESQTINIDSSQVSTRKFDTQLSEKYTGRDFDYSVETGQSQNYLIRAIQWFFEKLGKLFGIDVDPGMYETVEIFIYVILIIAAVFIITKLFLGTNTSSFFSKKSSNLAPISFEEEHIEKINLDELISNALLQSDYRLAIRYMFLKTLKELSVKNLISWHYDKTNLDYQNELKSPTLKHKFENVSYLYDHIWYGEFGLDEIGFNTAKKEFDYLQKVIHRNG